MIVIVIYIVVIRFGGSVGMTVAVGDHLITGGVPIQAIDATVLYHVDLLLFVQCFEVDVTIFEVTVLKLANLYRIFSSIGIGMIGINGKNVGEKCQ